MSSRYQQAIDSGYSDEEIQSYLSKKDPKFQQALQEGYSTQEISDFLEKKTQPKESPKANVGRQVGRSAARVAETVLGAPRALGEFGESIVPEKALKAGAEKIGLRQPVEKGLEFAKKYAPYKLFPKSEDIRQNVTKTLFGKKFEPKNEWEAKADELVEDFAALAIPLPGSQFKLLKPGILAAGGNIAKEIVGKMGGSEKEKTWAKLGTFLFGSLINPGSANKLKNELYSKAREVLPADAKINAKSLIKSTDNIEKELMKGDPTAPSKKKALSLMKEIRSKVQNNEIDVNELEEFKRNINEARSSLYDEFKTDKLGRKSAKRNLDTVSKLVDNSLSEYGKINPEWEAFYRPANEVHGAIAQSHKARNWFLSKAKFLGHLPLLAELGLYHYGGAAPALGAAAVGTAAVMGGELGVRIMKSPTLRKHYMNIVNSALKDDIIAAKKNLDKLEKEIKEES